MKKNEELSEYNDETQQVPWKRVILILLALIIVIIIILLLLKSCGNNSGDKLNEDLLKAGKDYYTENYPLLPQANGECSMVSLKQLVDAKLLDGSKYSNCNDSETLVKVCYLESNKYHYVPILSCDKEKTEFGTWQEGIEEDLVKDESDVRFTFLGEELKKVESEESVKNYYPNNLTSADKVKEYYIKSPAKDYTNKDSKTDEAYKWYTEKKSTIYWNNGGYSSTQPEGYPNKGESKKETELTVTKPKSASYRTIENVTLYRTQEIARPFKYKCIDRNLPANSAIISDTVCEKRNATTHLITLDIYYTCDGTNKVDQGTACGKASEWTTKKCETDKIKGINCESKAGYKYTDTKWKWYKNTTTKSYYPSGKASADLENTYYISSPVTGAIKDTSTKATAYKFYKVIDSKTTSEVEEWIAISDEYVDLDTMINQFKALNYDVDSLVDINNNEKLRYKLKLEFRNKVK